MKIGILTLPLWNNYGGILQAYALQKVLKNNNIETLFIDYHHKIPTKKTLLINSFKKKLKSEILHKKDVKYYPNHFQLEFISKKTLAFIVRELMPKTVKLYSYEDLKKLNDSIDGFIVGSDQVWRPNYTPNIYRYFLDFVTSEKLKIAYAASFGTDNWLFNDEQTKNCKKLLNEFDAVSVREYSGIDLVKEKFEMDVIKTLDPTLLLTLSDYLKLTNEYQESKSNGTLFYYILDENEESKTIIERVADTLTLRPFKVMPKSFDKYYRSKDESYIFPNVTKWIKAFQDAEFVIADSFHGCAFSILFNKPFLAIGNTERGLTRFHSLLKTFNLENRLILNRKDLTEDLMHKEIDWIMVNSILEQQREIAFNFLINTILNAKY